MTAGNGKKRRRKGLDRQNLRREVARASQQYQTILDACDVHLKGETGSFDKDQILIETGMITMAKAIRWDYIIEFLEDPADQYGFSLIAVAQSFFDEEIWKRGEWTAEADEADMLGKTALAGRYTAVGHAKRTAGYTLAKLHGGRLLLYRMEVSERQRKGKSAAIHRKIKRNINDPEIDSKVKDDLAAIAQIEGPKLIH